MLLVVRHGRSPGLLEKLIMGSVEALVDKLIRKSTVLRKLNEKYEKTSFVMFLYCGKMSRRHCWLADSSCDKKYPASSSSIWLLTVDQGKEMLSASDFLWSTVSTSSIFSMFPGESPYNCDKVA